MTAGHCVSTTAYWYENFRERDINNVIAQINTLSAKLESMRPLCDYFECMVSIDKIEGVIEKLEQTLQLYQTTTVDRFTIKDINGTDTGITATSDHRGDRDYGFIKGNFKSFDKLPLKHGFDVRHRDVLKVCGFPGSKVPATCIDYTAVSPDNFYYKGISMFVPGISGSPVIDHEGYVVGVASHVKGSYSFITPILGTVDFEYE